MEMLFENLNFMHWLVLGLSLIILELFLWTVFLLWIGVSAISVSIFFYLMPDTSWPIQLLIFVILSLTTTNLAKRYYPVKTVDDELHEKAKTFIGKECKVSSIDDGAIKVKIGNSLWFAKGTELSVGQTVKIIDVESSTFIVEPVDS